jgi:hypothetical protein
MLDIRCGSRQTERCVSDIFILDCCFSIQDLGDYGCTESRQNVKVVSAAPNTAPTLLHLIIYLNYGANLLVQLSYTVATL